MGLVQMAKTKLTKKTLPFINLSHGSSVIATPDFVLQTSDFLTVKKKSELVEKIDTNLILVAESANPSDTELKTASISDLPDTFDLTAQKEKGIAFWSEPKYKTVLERLLNNYNWTILDIFRFVYKFGQFPSVSEKPQKWSASPKYSRVKINPELYDDFKVFYDSNINFLELIYQDFVLSESSPIKEESSDNEGGDN